jgi:hypothetical protein
MKLDLDLGESIEFETGVIVKWLMLLIVLGALDAVD